MKVVATLWLCLLSVAVVYVAYAAKVPPFEERLGGSRAKPAVTVDQGARLAELEKRRAQVVDEVFEFREGVNDPGSTAENRAFCERGLREYQAELHRLDAEIRAAMGR